MDWRTVFTGVLLAFASSELLAAEQFGQNPSEGGAVEPAAYSTPPAGGETPAAIQAAAPLTEEQAREVEMIRQLARHRGGQPEALAQIVQLAAPYGAGVGAELLDELAASHRRAGDVNLAAEVRTHLAERYPNEPLARSAILWLVRLYASGEVAHARRGESQGTANMRRQLSPRMAAALGETPTSVEGGPAVSATADKSGEQLSLYALHFATQAMGSQQALADDPALGFQRSVAARRAGQIKSWQAFLSPLKRRAAADPWGQCARAEEWLLDRKDEASPKGVLPCVVAEAPPYLDGQLDDACWQSATVQPAPAAYTDAESLPADVRLAYDEKYLYIGVRCAKLANIQYGRDDRPRPRDANVEAFDRVRLLIDVDRDYASWFELLIDSRGWTADRCWGDPAWNPRWFIAAGETADGAAWTAEAVVPLSELAAKDPTASEAWAIATTRSRPGETAPTELSPTWFSLLLFE